MEGRGPKGEVLILMDAPNRQSIDWGKPFSEPGIHTLKKSMDEVGLDPEKVRFEYVVGEELTQSHFLDFDQKHPSPKLYKWFNDVQLRITNQRPKVIMICGDLGLKALTKYYSLNFIHCYVIKHPVAPIVPSLPPHFFLPQRSPHERYWLSLALQKVQNILSGTKDFEHKFTIAPSKVETLNFLKRCYGRKICVDIEKTMETHQLTTLGIALNEREAISIPFKMGGESYWNEQDEMDILLELGNLLAHRGTGKIFQNFSFDCLCLYYMGMPVGGTIYDTMVNAHVINPELPKGLAHLGRIYTYGEPWKSAQDWDGSNPRELWTYSCLDVVRTYEIYNKQEAQIREEGLLEFRNKYVHPVVQKMHEMCCRGLKVDTEALKEESLKLKNDIKELKQAINTVAQPYLVDKLIERKGPAIPGTTYVMEDREPLDISYKFQPRTKGPSIKGLSKYPHYKIQRIALLEDQEFKQLKELPFTVYESKPRKFNPGSSPQKMEVLEAMGLEIPRDFRKKSGKSVDAKALAKLIKKYPDFQFLKDLVKYASLKTQYSNYALENLRLDPDGRLRSELSFTETGRFKSGETGFNTGRNTQNFPRDKTYNFKRAIIPDSPELEFAQLDLSAVEAYFVAHLSQDENLLRILHEGGDLHQYMADFATEFLGQKVSRQEAKVVNHSGNYGIGKWVLYDIFTANGLDVSIDLCEKLLEARQKAFPGVVKWWEQVQNQILETRCLISPTGRKRYFYGRVSRKDDGTWSHETKSMFKEALAQNPQSMTPDYINQCWIAVENLDPRITVMQQCHDSLLFQYPIKDREECLKNIKKVFDEAFIEINGEKLHVPYDINTGKNWGELE